MKVDKKKLEDISIVKDFPKVFPEELTKFHPLRQTKFHIDLVLEATPVAKALYRLAPSKKQELLYYNTSTLQPSLKYFSMFVLLIVSTDEFLRSLFGRNVLA
ncbi:hypothetical protein Tco_1106993 [Tanacetum coccineum]